MRTIQKASATPGDYRIFVGAFPDGALAETLQTLRRRYDPVTARITPPHVTLWGTQWRHGPPTPQQEAETIATLTRHQKNIPPFSLELGGIEAFEGGVVYLAVRCSPELLVVRERLLQALGPDKHGQFMPHVTLAMRLDAAKTQAALAELRQSAWQTTPYIAPIQRLYLMQRGPSDPAWRAIFHFSLGD